MDASLINHRDLEVLLAELSDLPPKPPRSKLEPHRELIRELRRKGRTYREVARLFEERLGLHVAPSTLHSFVKVRARHRKRLSSNCHRSKLRHPGEVTALKAKATGQATKRQRFVFRENEPLTLSNDGGTR